MKKEKNENNFSLFVFKKRRKEREILGKRNTHIDVDTLKDPTILIALFTT